VIVKLVSAIESLDFANFDRLGLELHPSIAIVIDIFNSES